MTIKDIQILAEEHGLLLTENIRFNEMGIDFRVGFAIDNKGQRWLLRIPRRNDMSEQIDKEKRILHLVKKHLSVKVPDWKITSPKLIVDVLNDKSIKYLLTSSSSSVGITVSINATYVATPFFFDNSSL